MRNVLILVLAMAFYACVNCEESATTVVKNSVPIVASVRGGDRHEDQDRNYKILVKKVDLLRTSLLTHQRQLTESQQQSKMLQDQLQSEKAIVVQLKQQVSKLVDENVKNGVKHQAQDKDYANLLVQIQQLQSILTTHEQRLQASQAALEASQQQTSLLQSQLQSENSTLVQLQNQVSDLAVASAKSDQKHQIQDMDNANQLLEIQQLKINLSSNQEQLDESKLQTTSLQALLQNKTVTIELLQRQVSDLITSNLTAIQAIQLLQVNLSSNQKQLDNKTATIDLLQSRVSDLIAANVTAAQAIQLLQSNLSSNQQQLQESKVLTTSLQTQLDNKTTTIAQLQRQISDLIAANVTAAQQIQQLNMNVTNQQNQLTALQQGPAIQWVPWTPTDALPQNAIIGGLNWDNIPMYVGRTNYSNTAIVVKACPTIAKALFSYFGKEYESTNTEVLTGSGFSWKWGSNGNVPDKAFSVGKHSSGSLLYIGRVHHPHDPYGSSLTPGTVVTGTGGALYISFAGSEYQYFNYQVLVHG